MLATCQTDYRKPPSRADREEFPVRPGKFPEPPALGRTTDGAVRTKTCVAARRAQAARLRRQAGGFTNRKQSGAWRAQASQSMRSPTRSRP